MESRLTIYRGALKVAEVIPSSDSSLTREIGKARTLNLEWTHHEAVSVRRGDYVSVDGELFFFFGIPTEEKVSTLEYQYTATLHGEEKMLEQTLCLYLDQIDGYTVSSQSQFTLNATASEILSLIVRNINRNVSEQWSYRVDKLEKDGEVLTLDMDGSTCNEVLTNLCNEAEAEWMFNADTHTLVLSDKDSIERRRNLTLSYPDNLISPFTVKHGTEEATRLYVFGGERNIPTGYADGESNRLLMRGKLKYLEKAGLIPNEKVYTNDDIYPRRNSCIDNVRMSAKGFFFVHDSTLDFDINKQLTAGTTAKISFTTGRLVGYEFEIASYSSTTKTIEIKQQTDGDAVIPNETVRPEKGDKYVLLDILMPDSYVNNAEEELYEDALEYFEKECTDKITATVKVSSVWLDKEGVKLRPFDKVSIPYGKGTRDIRITRTESRPFEAETYGRGMDVTLSDFTEEGTIASLKNNVSLVRKTMNNGLSTLRRRSETLTEDTNKVSDQLTWQNG